jgi:hypothetical protein
MYDAINEFDVLPSNLPRITDTTVGLRAEIWIYGIQNKDWYPFGHNARYAFGYMY